MEKRTWSVLVSTAEGRRDRQGLKEYRIMHRIDGLTESQADGIRYAVHGRMTGPNRIDVVDGAGKEMLANAAIGYTFSTNW